VQVIEAGGSDRNPPLQTAEGVIETLLHKMRRETSNPSPAGAEEGIETLVYERGRKLGKPFPQAGQEAVNDR
jgi:hypothetical protein